MDLHLIIVPSFDPLTRKRPSFDIRKQVGDNWWPRKIRKFVGSTGTY